MSTIEFSRKKYCSHCGKELLVRRVGAERYGKSGYYLMYFTPNDKYNKDNGKRQYHDEEYCPDYGKWFSGSHDCHGIGEVYTI